MSFTMERNFDQRYWENLWTRTIDGLGGKLALRPPNQHLVTAATPLPPGRALDLGCGHGAETLWLAARGWEVTAVDFSASALATGRKLAEAADREIAARIEWVEADLEQWNPLLAEFDLAISLYVHIPGSVAEFVQRIAGVVRPGGTLVLVGHRPVDPATGSLTAAANQVQISFEEAQASLPASAWEWMMAENRVRAVPGSGVDAVVVARRTA